MREKLLLQLFDIKDDKNKLLDFRKKLVAMILFAVHSGDYSFLRDFDYVLSMVDYRLHLKGVNENEYI